MYEYKFIKQLKLYFIYFITIYTNRLRIPYNTIYLDYHRCSAHESECRQGCFDLWRTGCNTTSDSMGRKPYEFHGPVLFCEEGWVCTFMLACAKIKDSKGKSNPYGTPHFLRINRVLHGAEAAGCKGMNGTCRIKAQAGLTGDTVHGTCTEPFPACLIQNESQKVNTGCPNAEASILCRMWFL